MRQVGRWVVVDDSAMTIVGGPYLWDGHTDWEPPRPGRLVGEADALNDGYTYPQPDGPVAG